MNHKAKFKQRQKVFLRVQEQIEKKVWLPISKTSQNSLEKPSLDFIFNHYWNQTSSAITQLETFVDIAVDEYEFLEDYSC